MRAVLALLLVTALGIGAGQAATLPLPGAVNQTGSDSLACDEDTVSLSYVTVGDEATGARIEGIDAACAGLVFQFFLFTDVGTTTITGTALYSPTQNIPFAAVPISNVEGAKISFHGAD